MNNSERHKGSKWKLPIIVTISIAVVCATLYALRWFVKGITFHRQLFFSFILGFLIGCIVLNWSKIVKAISKGDD